MQIIIEILDDGGDILKFAGTAHLACTIKHANSGSSSHKPCSSYKNTATLSINHFHLHSTFFSLLISFSLHCR